MKLLMTCLLGYIGILGCNAVAPDSGLLINQLPGINLESIDKIADAEQVTYLKVWEDVEKRALQRFHTAVTNYFSKQYKLKRVAQNIDLGKSVDAVDNQTARANELRGFTVELTYPNSNFVNSSLQVIHVQSLEFYSKAIAAGVVFKVINIDTGEELDEFTKDVVVGWNSIALNKNYDAYRILIAYNATAIESVEQLLPGYLNGWCDCVCEVFGCEARIKGATADSPFTEITDTGNNVFGLTANISIQCKYDAIVCNNKAVFATALWYMLGAELMTERIYSDRLNRYTTVDRKKAIELRDEFTQAWQNELMTALDGIQIDVNDCCIECDAVITYKETVM